VKVEIVPTTLEHVRVLAADLRELERNVMANAEATIAQEVSRSLITFTGLGDNYPVVICGARSAGILADSAYVWLVASSRIETCPLTFVRHSRRAVEMLHQHFKSLHGLVREDFGCSARWLEWLGFKLDTPIDGFQAFHLE